VGPVLELQAGTVGDPDESFVNQRRGLERVGGGLAPEEPAGEGPELVVDDLHQECRGGLITVGQRCQHLCQVFRALFHDGQLYRSGRQ